MKGERFDLIFGRDENDVYVLINDMKEHIMYKQYIGEEISDIVKDYIISKI